MHKIQIRETIRAHLDKERALFQLGIKVLNLSLMKWPKYRVYDQNDTPLNGKYTEFFSVRMRHKVAQRLAALDLGNDPYLNYLRSINVHKNHVLPA